MQKQAISSEKLDGFEFLFRFAEKVGFNKVTGALHNLAQNNNVTPSWMPQSYSDASKLNDAYSKRFQKYNKTWLQSNGADNYQRALKLFELYSGQNEQRNRGATTTHCVCFFRGSWSDSHGSQVEQALSEYIYNPEKKQEDNITNLLEIIAKQVNFESLQPHGDMQAILDVIEFHTEVTAQQRIVTQLSP